MFHIRAPRRSIKTSANDFLNSNQRQLRVSSWVPLSRFSRHSLHAQGHEFCTRFALKKGEDLMWNEDEVRGKIDQTKGKLKEKIGEMNNDEQLREEGEADRAAGNVEEAFGKGRRKVGEAIKDVGKKISR